MRTYTPAYINRQHLHLIQGEKTFKCESILEFLVNNTLHVTLDFEYRTALNFHRENMFNP